MVISEGPPARYKIVGYAAETRMVVYDSEAGRWALGPQMPQGFRPTAAAAVQQYRGGRACAVLFLGYGPHTGSGESALQLLSYELLAMEEEPAAQLRVVVEVAGALGAGEARGPKLAQGLVFVPGEELPLVVSQLSRGELGPERRVARPRVNEFWAVPAPSGGWRSRRSCRGCRTSRRRWNSAVSEEAAARCGGSGGAGRPRRRGGRPRARRRRCTCARSGTRSWSGAVTMHVTLAPRRTSSPSSSPTGPGRWFWDTTSGRGRATRRTSTPSLSPRWWRTTVQRRTT